MSQSTIQRVEIPKQKFIEVSKDSFIKELSKTFESTIEQDQFLQLSNIIQHLLDAKRVQQRELVKKSYSCFDERNHFSKIEANKLSVEELGNRQNTLLQNIYDILIDSNFEPITFENYKNAIQSVYLSDLPIVLDYKYFFSYFVFFWK